MRYKSDFNFSSSDCCRRSFRLPSGMTISFILLRIAPVILPTLPYTVISLLKHTAVGMWIPLAAEIADIVIVNETEEPSAKFSPMERTLMLPNWIFWIASVLLAHRFIWCRDLLKFESKVPANVTLVVIWDANKKFNIPFSIFLVSEK